ncbi:MAG: hypothetical protein ACT4PL_07730, partial [Phycisphaerales bacterium]
MTKLLRKYRNGVMIGFGIFLMVAFLLTSTLQDLVRQTTGPSMVVGGTSYDAETQRALARKGEAVKVISNDIVPQLVGFDPRGVSFILAMEEAKQAGYIGGPSSGRGFPPIYMKQLADREAMRLLPYMNDPQFRPLIEPQLLRAQEEAQQIAAQMVDQREFVAMREGLLEKDVDDALAMSRGIQEYRSAYLTSAASSERRLIREARRLRDMAQVDLVFIGVDGPLSEGMPVADEERLKAFFEKYKSVKPGAGEMGFGYLRPAQVKLEWVRIERGAVSTAVKVDPVLVQQRLVAQAKLSPPPPGDTGGPARSLAMAETIRQETTAAALADAAIAAKAAILAPVSKLPQDGGYVVLPSAAGEWEAKRPTAAAIAAHIASSVMLPSGSPDPAAPKLPLPAPVAGMQPEWVAIESLDEVKDIGVAFLRRGNTAPVSLREIAGQIRELSGKKSDLGIRVQRGVPLTETLEDALSNRYVVCFTDVRDAAPPASLDEVREAVIADVKKADAFEKLSKDLPGYIVVASETGVDDVDERVRAAGGRPDARKSEVVVRG